MIVAYRDPDRTRGRQLMTELITSISSGVPDVLAELATLGRTLTKRAADVLAYFDRPGTSNAPPRPSTAAWNTSAAPPSASATSPTTSPEACSRPAASDPDYTLHWDEPVIRALNRMLSFPPKDGHLGCGVSDLGLVRCGGSRR
jgi:hypothetical protein